MVTAENPPATAGLSAGKKARLQAIQIGQAEKSQQLKEILAKRE